MSAFSDHIRSHSPHATIAALCVVVVGLSCAAGCRRSAPAAAPLATPSVTLNHDRVSQGSPLEITYKFVVVADARFDEDFRVFVHVLDADEELMWNDDHNPPVPTTSWKPGQTVEYTRTVFVPNYPYVGEATIQIGLHSTKDQRRVPLAGEDVGHNSYKVARLQLTPPTDNIITVFKEGWHPAEVVEHNASVQWSWTKRVATLAFKNPKKDCVLYLDLDNPSGVFHDQQEVSVALNGEEVDRFTMTPGKELLRKIALPGAKMGDADMAEIRLSVDKTFVPAQLTPASKDTRELGVRVFHAFVDRAR